jgi:VWFA-related protein
MRILLGLVVAGLLAAQQQGEPMPSISVDVSLVSVLASVRDRHGALIPNLQQSDFSVYEDGKLQTIKYFARENDLSMTIGMLVDVSGSQLDIIDIERRAASAFFADVMRKKDEAFLISFGEESELLQDFTGSPRLLEEGLRRLRPGAAVGGLHPGPVPTISQPRGTVLWDAIYLAATEKLASETGRKAIVVITDGVDQGSRMTRAQAIEAAQKGDVVVYSIYYSDPRAYSGTMLSIGGGDSDLRKISEETGGRVFRVDRSHSLESIFRELQDEMRCQYMLGYTPTRDNWDGAYRKLEVRMASKDLKAQTRKGYYASKPSAR